MRPLYIRCRCCRCVSNVHASTRSRIEWMWISMKEPHATLISITQDRNAVVENCAPVLTRLKFKTQFNLQFNHSQWNYMHQNCEWTVRCALRFFLSQWGYSRAADWMSMAAPDNNFFCIFFYPPHILQLYYVKWARKYSPGTQLLCDVADNVSGM